jgi:hypothetical protein
MSTPVFSPDFCGPGPMFAAVNAGDAWYGLAAKGATTYLVEAQQSEADWYVGGSAFLDRAPAEAVADAAGHGFVTCWHGLSGRVEPAAARAEADLQAEAGPGLEAEL